MNTKMKKVLTGIAALLVAVALIVIAPVSRIVYMIYDNNRTNEILQQLEAEATLTADQVAALQQVEVPVAELVRVELETSQEGKPFVLVLRDNGTLLTGWTNYEQTMLEGKWTVTDGVLVLEMDYPATIAENAAGGLDVTVNYGQMGEKIYALTADQAKALLN